MTAILRDSRDLALVCCVAAADAALVFADAGPVWLRAVLGVPVVLFFVGYVLTVALFPARTVDAIDRVLYSIGASLALTALAGLGLDATSAGLVSRGWMLGLFAMVIVFAAIGAARRARGGEVELRLTSSAVAAVVDATRSWGLTAVIVVVMLVGAVSFDRHDALAVASRTGITELWLLPGPDSSSVQLGVMHQGERSQRYDLVLRRGAHLTFRAQGITLRSGQRWTKTILFSRPLRSMKTTAALYLQGSRRVLRFAKLGVAVSSSRPLRVRAKRGPRRRRRVRQGPRGRVQ